MDARGNSVKRVLNSIGTPAETEVMETVYRKIKPMNFSKGLLEVFSVQYAGCLGVLPVRGVFWSDWGSEQRIKSILQSMYPMTLSSDRKYFQLPMVSGKSVQLKLLEETA